MIYFVAIELIPYWLLCFNWQCLCIPYQNVPYSQYIAPNAVDGFLRNTDEYFFGFDVSCGTTALLDTVGVVVY